MATTLTPQERQHYGLESDHAPRDEYGMTARERRLHHDMVHAAWVAVMARRAEYARECQDYRDQGHRPHYCIHGTDLWVDYDNICGGCEDSRSDTEWADLVAHEHVHRVLVTTLMYEKFQYTAPERARVISAWVVQDWAAALNPSL